MKIRPLISLFIMAVLIARLAYSTNHNTADSLLNLLQMEEQDTAKVNLYAQLSKIYL